MSLTDEQKLDIFSEEVFSEVEEYCDEIITVIDKEKNEKIEEGEKKLYKKMYEYIQTEQVKIRREKSLATSKRNTELRQEYLRQIESISGQVLSGIKYKLHAFRESDSYSEYLKKSSLKTVSQYSDTSDILYSPKDEKYMESVKAYLTENAADISQISFTPDNSIKMGGFKFYNRDKKLQINETFEAKLIKAEENLSDMIGEVFTNIEI